MIILQDGAMCPAAPRLSQVETKLTISSVAFNREERERDLGPYPDIILSPEKRDFRSRAECTLNPKEKTSYLPVVISPRFKHVPIRVGAVTDSSGYVSPDPAGRRRYCDVYTHVRNTLTYIR